MMPATATAMTVYGITGRTVAITARRVPGHAALTVATDSGRYLPEVRDRVRAGLVNAGLRLPASRLSVQIGDGEPTDVAASTDLAVAASILVQAGSIPVMALQDVALIGEIGLDGQIRPVRGVLVMVRAAVEHGIPTVVVPAANAGEAALVSGIRVVAAGTLADFTAWASSGRAPAAPADPPPLPPSLVGGKVSDLLHVPAGLTFARYGVEVAAAGGHHISMTGPVGSATILLARSLPTLLPDLDDDGTAKVSGLYSIAGQLTDAALTRRPPVQAPHCSTSVAALIGGRRPGAISLAHRGVLLLEDAVEFGARTLACLREPMRTGRVALIRAPGTVTYPARFQLVLTGKPCPCSEPACVCSPAARRRYQQRLVALGSHPDINLEITPTDTDCLSIGESSAQAAARVGRARASAADRWRTDRTQVNADLPLADLTGRYRLPRPTTATVTRLVDVGALSLTGYASVLRVAWTVSDLRGAQRPDQDAIDAAIALHLARTP